MFIDNSDQRDYETQQTAFLISQEIASNWAAIVFFPLRPETFHTSIRSGGALSGYHAKAFTINPPRIDRVLEKRIIFAIHIARGDIPIVSLHNTNVILTNLEDILNIILDNLGKNHRRDIPEAIENLSGGNVRLALDILKTFLGSGHVNTEKIIRIYRETGEYTIPLHEFIRAIIYGDQVYYDPQRSRVANMFDLSNNDPKEHFLMPIALDQLARWGESDQKDGYIDNTRFYNHLQGMGYTADQIDSCLIRAQNYKLIDFSSRKSPVDFSNSPPSLRATAIGIYHARKLINKFAYIDAMIVDTPILNNSTKWSEEFLDVSDVTDRLSRAEHFCDYLDEQWTEVSLAADPFEWNRSSALIRRDIQHVRSKINHR